MVVHKLFFLDDAYGLFKDEFESFGTDAEPPFAERGIVEGGGRLKINFAAEVLPVGILKPSCGEFFVGEVVGVFEIFESDRESSGQGGSTVVVAIEWIVGFIEAVPLDCVGELAEGMVEVELRVESGLEELAGGWGVLGGFLRFHGGSNLQGIGRKTRCFAERYCRL